MVASAATSTSKKNASASATSAVTKPTSSSTKDSSGGINLLLVVFFLLAAAAVGLFAGKVSTTVAQQSRALTADPPFAKNVSVYDNGQSIGGVNVTLLETHVTSGTDLAAYLSDLVDVEGIELAGEAPSKVIADRVYTGNGKLVNSFDDIASGDLLYLVAPGLLFVWPFVHLGHKVHVKAKMSPTKQDIVLESLSESPRVFHVHNFFDYAEADALIERILTIDDEKNKLQQSHVGHRSGAKKVSPHRTSENAFDQVSDVAVAIRKRSFDLLRIPKYQDDMSDGLQLLRYQQKQAYIPHTDYFATQTSADWNWNPKSGGSNRFATVFLYLSNVTVGGQTVFPLSYMPEGHEHPPMTAEAKALSSTLFEKDSWEQDMVDKCSSRLASYPRKSHAILFYSQKPNGELDPMSVHGGCPVLDGTKWAANLWVWNKRRHGLDQSRKDKIQVKFLNPNDFPVELFWTNSKLATIPPHGRQPYSSFDGHEWVMRDEAGNLLLAHKLSVNDGLDQDISVPVVAPPNTVAHPDEL
ncbi:Aste57867_9143 [Aphanomyces stellatus]|uniref:Aste57867_9143 protein n=1 Tax=Aphanomyces stellatus TaxID=120398 RepID=A0A485KM23_9STRA|nr:hypothetical protein As57867_009107 [Aphanomyces stellatus]VFT86027.1 Aste57867_9143 [Aphanomyces stellatus]